MSYITNITYIVFIYKGLYVPALVTILKAARNLHKCHAEGREASERLFASFRATYVKPKDTALYILSR